MDRMGRGGTNHMAVTQILYAAEGFGLYRNKCTHIDSTKHCIKCKTLLWTYVIRFDGNLTCNQNTISHLFLECSNKLICSTRTIILTVSFALTRLLEELAFGLGEDFSVQASSQLYICILMHFCFSCQSDWCVKKILTLFIPEQMGQMKPLQQPGMLSCCRFTTRGAQAVPDMEPNPDDASHRSPENEEYMSLSSVGIGMFIIRPLWKCCALCQVPHTLSLTAWGPYETGNWKPLVVGGLFGGPEAAGW